MEINVTGSVSAKIKRYMNEATMYYIGRLMSTHMLKNIAINVSIRKKVENNDEGFCEVTGWNSLSKPREFKIVIKKDDSVRKMLMTLAHEVVHVKQYAVGELSENHASWRGKRVNEDVDYWESPWEIEAFGRERGLYTMFCEKHNYQFTKHSNERDA